MAPVTDSPRNRIWRLLLNWTNRLSLTARILAVNILALFLMMSGLFFLDSYRARLIAERIEFARTDAYLIASLLPRVKAEERLRFVEQYARVNDARIRLYAADGTKILDSFNLGPPPYRLASGPEAGLLKRLALQLDHIVDLIVLAHTPPPHVEPRIDRAGAWPEIRDMGKRSSLVMLRNAEDSTPVISAAARSPAASYTVLFTSNPRDVRASVRAERSDIFLFFFFVLLVSVLLSFFLARTIVRPLRHLAYAATKVRLGRAREVAVPRLPDRRDEIGLLARALSDMSNALRQRIDATEAFAADVTHEIKNPLASLRSALESLGMVDDPALKASLMQIAREDVQRIDRLISDIAEASRVDSQMAKAKLERIDLGDMIEQVVAAYKQRSATDNRGVRIAYARPRKSVAVVMGEDIRLERVLDNLIDNALSFSPPGGLVEVIATCADDEVLIMVRDQGPGVPESEREAIFRRFHSARPADEQFGTHSGLGLAIARTIIEGHHGTITVGDREDGRPGACFRVRLPRAPAAG